MKGKTLFLVTAVSAIFTISCRKEEPAPQKSDAFGLVFTATIDDSESKTIIDTDSGSATAGKVSWEITDTITIRDQAENTAVYKVSSLNGGKATFEYKSGAELGTGPYTASYGCEPTVEQTYSAVAGKLPMTASSETTSLTFRATCGLLKITLSKAGESIKSITVTGTPTGRTEMTYRLTCADAQSIESAKDFFVALPAGKYDKYVFYNSGRKACTKTAKSGNSTVIETNRIQPITFSTSLSFDDDYIVDLGLPGTANCYIVSSAGTYKFKTVKGGSSDSVGNVKGVKVLWESFGTDVAPSVGDLLRADVSYADNYITFSTNDAYKEGNAVIAAYSDTECSDGKVLWSWHIWLTDRPEEQVYKNDAGTMMDRNLGATSAAVGDVHSLGLLYQWGRKDPFIGNVSVTSESPYGTSAASTITWPHTAYSNASKGTIEYTIAHPTKFITCDTTSTSNNDWYYTGGSETDNTRWKTSNEAKTIYDPCPAGWRVPDGGENSVWAKALGSSSEFSKGPWDSTNRGMNFGSGNGKGSSMQLGTDETIWYPATGCRSYSVGGIKWPGSNGYYWTTSPADASAYSFFFDLTGKVIPSSGRERAAGRSVRCISET